MLSINFNIKLTWIDIVILHMLLTEKKNISGHLNHGNLDDMLIVPFRHACIHGLYGGWHTSYYILYVVLFIY